MISKLRAGQSSGRPCPRMLLACALAALVAAGLAGRASAASCPEANPTYTSSCGPEFVTPAWGNAAGWNDPSQYSTIRLADVNGDGEQELLGRADDGLEIWEFDTTLGQWRPQVDANGRPAVLTDFRSPLPGQSGANWDQPQYYSTIQATSLDGGPAEEILARFPDGMRVYKYFPPAGTKNIDGGTWKVISRGGPFSDAAGFTDPSTYLTIRTGVVDPNIDPNVDLFARSHAGLVAYGWTGSGWAQASSILGQNVAGRFDDSACSKPSCYLEFRTAQICYGCGVDHDVLIARDFAGVDTIKYETGYGGRAFWDWWAGSAAGDADDNPAYMFGDNGGPDCPFATGPPSGQSDCFGTSPAYYETLRSADIDGAQIFGQPSQELLGRASDGLRVKKFLGPPSYKWTSLPTLTNPSYYSTIQVGDVNGDGRDDVIARGPYGIRTFFYNRRGTGGWESYLPGGYQQFSTAGQQAAFAQLNSQARNRSVIPLTASTVRDVWTGENAPAPSELSLLQQGILSLASCSGPNPGNPPSFASCTPPSGSTGFTAADWTAVVNEMLSEIFDAQQVLAQFSQLTSCASRCSSPRGHSCPRSPATSSWPARRATPPTSTC